MSREREVWLVTNDARLWKSLGIPLKKIAATDSTEPSLNRAETRGTPVSREGQ